MANAAFTAMVEISSQPSLANWEQAPSTYTPPFEYRWDYPRWMTRWYLHHVGAIDQPLPMNGENYLAVYRPESGGEGSYLDMRFAQGSIGADGLPTYTQSALDVVAICLAACLDLRDIPSMDVSSRVTAMPAIYYGEPEAPITPRFWTGMVNAVEVV